MKQLVDLIHEFGSGDIIEISRNLNMQIIDFNLNTEIDAILTCIDNHTRILTYSPTLEEKRKLYIISYMIAKIFLHSQKSTLVLASKVSTSMDSHDRECHVFAQELVKLQSKRGSEHGFYTKIRN